MSETDYTITPPAAIVPVRKPAAEPKPERKLRRDVLKMGAPKDPHYNMQFIFNMRAPSGRIFTGFNAEQVRIQTALGWELTE